MKLEIELVPSTVWYSSLYRLLPKNKWSRLKEKVYAKEGYKCYVCGSGHKPFSLHEFWEYDDDKHIQRLSGVHHLCNLCHKIKHIGFWCHTADGIMKLKQEGLERNNLVVHFCRVNHSTKEEFLEHEDKAFDVWRARSDFEWKQDFGTYEESIKK